MPYQLVQDYFHQQSETISWQNMAKLRSPAKGLTFNFKTRNKFAGAKGIRNHQRFAKLLFSIWLASLKIHLKDAFRQMFPWIRSFSTFGLHLVRVFNRLGPVIRYHYTFLLFFSHGNWKVNKKIWKHLKTYVLSMFNMVLIKSIAVSIGSTQPSGWNFQNILRSPKESQGLQLLW